VPLQEEPSQTQSEIIGTSDAEDTEHAAKNVKINFGAKWYHKTLQQVHEDPEGREWIAFMLDKKVFNKKHAKHLRPGMLLLGYTLDALPALAPPSLPVGAPVHQPNPMPQVAPSGMQERMHAAHTLLLRMKEAPLHQSVAILDEAMALLQV